MIGAVLDGEPQGFATAPRQVLMWPSARSLLRVVQIVIRRSEFSVKLQVALLRRPFYKGETFYCT